MVIGTKDQDNIHIYGSEDDTLWLAQLGTTLPTGLGDPGDAFNDVGFTGESGFDLNREDDVQAFKVHQAGKTVRKKVTSSSTSLVFRTVEENETTDKLADNIVATETAGLVTTQTISSARKVQTYAAVLDLYDDGIMVRRAIPRFEVAGGGTETFSNSALTEREFTGEIIGDHFKIVGPVPEPEPAPGSGE